MRILKAVDLQKIYGQGETEVLHSLRKNAHSCFRFLLILGIAAPFCRSRRCDGTGGI